MLQSKEGPISLERNSTLSSDVEVVYHVPSHSLIVVKLLANASCSNPVLRCRLSGPSLSAFSFHPISDSEKKNLKKIPLFANDFKDVLIGNYGNRVLPGEHYIEIIHLYCNGWTNFSFDFSHICLEDPTRHRITEKKASIDILLSWSIDVPLWVNRMLERTQKDYFKMPFELGSKTLQPVYTRYQPTCPPGSDPSCIDAVSTESFMNYNFAWPRELDPALLLSHMRNLSMDNTTHDLNPKKVCFMGASHTREIRNHLYSVFGARTIDSVAAFDDKAKYTEYVQANAETFVTKSGCDSLVIGVGQWPAGWPGGRPQLFDEYKKNMESMLLSLVILKDKLEENNTGNSTQKALKLYLRSMHYNALGNRCTACPPTEWRNPFVIDGYNAIAKQLALESMDRVEFIDTDFIIGPMWDSPGDWCHFKNEAGMQDALFLLAKTLLPQTTIASVSISEKEKHKAVIHVTEFSLNYAFCLLLCFQILWHKMAQ